MLAGPDPKGQSQTSDGLRGALYLLNDKWFEGSTSMASEVMQAGSSCGATECVQTGSH